MAIGAIIFYSTLQNQAFEEDTISSSNHISKTQFKPKSASIPANYCQDIDLDGVYVYNVTNFGDADVSWYYFAGDRGKFNSDPGGKVIINFTGFYDRHPDDWGDEFPDTNMPYYDVEIYNSTDILPNFQVSNISNSEVGGVMGIGYNSFVSGFLIPIDNLTNIKKMAIDAHTGSSDGKVIVEETFHLLYTSFEATDGLIKIYSVYDRWTGLLVWADILCYGLKLEINSLNFTINLDSTFNYTINDFGEPLSWFNLTNDFKGKANTNLAGLIKVNFTGDYDKKINDNSIFENPIPWIDIAFIENNTGVLNTNFTLSNISNSEAAINLQIGFNNFSSGFLIPTENLTSLKKNAINEESGDNPDDFLMIEETGLTIMFIFIEAGDVNFSAITYDKYTGLLMSMRAVSGDFLLDMELVLYYEESDPIPLPSPYSKTIYDTEEEKGDREFDNYAIPFLLLACGAGASIGMLILKKDIKTLKYLFTGILGSLCFSSLILFNYWFTTGVTSTNKTKTKLEIVEDITLIVDFGDDIVKKWESFTLSGGKTTALDALDKYCDIEYKDYGWGIIVKKIDGVDGNWLYEINGEKPGHGADRHYLRDSDTVKWIFTGKN